MKVEIFIQTHNCDKQWKYEKNQGLRQIMGLKIKEHHSVHPRLLNCHFLAPTQNVSLQLEL